MPEHTHAPAPARDHGHHHDHDHDHGQVPDSSSGPVDREEFWDAFYRERDQVWSGEANALLIREAEGLAPGRALDLGCGEGADSVWLARQGWQVTATDVSGVALGRAAAHAAEAGIGDRVEWQRHDLAESFPAGEFDLVSACFLHSHTEFPREHVLRTAAAAVAPGGILLVVGHGGRPSWVEEPSHQGVEFPSPDEVVARLELAEGAWEVLLAEEHVRVHHQPDGRAGTLADNVVKVRRTA
ncbi:class I SAM-dependent methyltransferase [Streptomyces sp. NPDC051567]|uniref:class I SAM-dependent methyltransferase n=1 Tax=Streptomyces sp. NPDC051567 TaxID=3365660 RepID=UPI0037BDBCF9